MKRSDAAADSSSNASLQLDRAWEKERVSAHSCAGDAVWQFEVRVPGRRASDLRVFWSLAESPGDSAPEVREALLIASKRFLLLMMTTPPSGRRRWGQSTASRAGKQLLVICEWMLQHGITSFRDLSAAHLDNFQSALESRTRHRRHRDRVSVHTVWCYMDVLAAMYQARVSLSDAPLLHPNPGASERQHLSDRKSDICRIPAIPDELAVVYLGSAVKWVEQHSEPILRVWELMHEFREAHRDCNIDTPGSPLRRALLAEDVRGPDGRRLFRASDIYSVANSLRTACIIAIGGLVGMRVSEILALRSGAIETRRDPVTDVPQTYLLSRLFKTTEASDGRPERWIAPAPAVRALAVLERINAPLQSSTGIDSLFIAIRLRQGNAESLSLQAVNHHLNTFASAVKVPPFEGRDWKFSTHQLRKTFARFVGMRDRSHLLALSQHFKHVSLAMTSQAYVGTDFELNELVSGEARTETAVALDRMLGSDQLAGRMGERIRVAGSVFRGRAGAQVRSDYISFIMQETDLRIHACDYGWCVFQPETARCGGERAPNDAARSPSVCLSCSNMVIEQRHAPYWTDRRERNARLLPVASLLAKASLKETIAQCDKVLRDLEKHRGKAKTQETGRPGSDCGAGVSRSTGQAAPRRRSTSKARRTGGTNNASVSRSRGSEESQSAVHNAPRHPRRNHLLD